MKIQVKALKNLIGESLLLETDCPSCGSEGAYVGLNDVECPNPNCTHFDEKMQILVPEPTSDPDVNDWFKREHYEAYADWIDYCQQHLDPDDVVFDVYTGDTPVASGPSGNEYVYEDGSWRQLDDDDDYDDDDSDYDEDDPAADMLGFPRLPGDPGYSP